MKNLLARFWQWLHLGKHVQLRIMRLMQNQFLVGVTGVILNDKKEILVVHHTYRGGKRWSLPGGYLKEKEHPKEGLAREIEEETGYIVRADKEIKIKTDRETARLDITMTGNYIGGTFTPSEEVSEAGFFSFDELPLLPTSHLLLIKHVLEMQ